MKKLNSHIRSAMIIAFICTLFCACGGAVPDDVAAERDRVTSEDMDSVNRALNTDIHSPQSPRYGN